MKTQIDVPPRYRDMIRKALEGKLTRAQAIKAKCIECCGFEVKQARDCGVETCPLYHVNPYRKRRR